MSGYYELKKTPKDKFMFNLKSGNHQVILTSELYETKAAAKNGIKSVQKNGCKATAFEKKSSTKKQPYFVLKSPNSQTIGKSEMYSSESSCAKGIASVTRNSSSVKIVEI